MNAKRSSEATSGTLKETAGTIREEGEYQASGPFRPKWSQIHPDAHGADDAGGAHHAESPLRRDHLR